MFNAGLANARRAFDHSGPANAGKAAWITASARARVFQSPSGVTRRTPRATSAQARSARDQPSSACSAFPQARATAAATP